MAAFILHAGATVLCMHAGQATPASAEPRVKVAGQAVTVQSSVYNIAGCSLPPPPNGNGPCTTAQWTSAATRVKAGGQPVLLQNSQAVCTPSGTGVNVASTQTRVKGT